MGYFGVVLNAYVVKINGLIAIIYGTGGDIQWHLILKETTILNILNMEWAAGRFYENL